MVLQRKHSGLIMEISYFSFVIYLIFNGRLYLSVTFFLITSFCNNRCSVKEHNDYFLKLCRNIGFIRITKKRIRLLGKQVVFERFVR